MESESDSDSDVMPTDSEEGEEEDSGDLSHLGVAATTVKFQTVQQRSFQVAEGGTERLAKPILDSCLSSNLELVSTSGQLAMEETRDIPVGSGTRVLQQNFIQVQQQFGDVTVQGTKNLTIGGTQNIGQTGPSKEEKGKAQTKAEQIAERTLTKIAAWTKGMVKTAALGKVLKKLNSGTNWVTVRGSPGEGKTTVAYMALEELHRTGIQVFHVTSPKEFSEVIATCSKSVIMLDDIFGNLEFDQAKWLIWEDVLQNVLDVKEHRSHEEQAHDSVTVILVGRDYVFNTASFNMGRLIDFFTQDEYVVNMSHTVRRDVREKRAIWDAISVFSGIELDENELDIICDITGPHGFPHVCRLFLTIQKKDPKISAEDFFRAPLEFLNQTVLKFMQNKLKLRVFKEMIKRDGKVSVRELERFDDGFETIQTAYDLVGTYLRKEDDIFLFDHPSIYDSVAYHIGKRHPLFVIENCNLSFIHERLRLHSAEPDTLSQDSGLVVHIPRSYARYLAKRFALEIVEQNLMQVLSHKVFGDGLFVNEVMSLLPPLNELVKLSDFRSGESFLSLLPSSKSPQLLKYVNNHRQLTTDEINMVLCGVCKYAASDVLSYLTLICNKLDINVKYGDKKQTPLMLAAEAKDKRFVEEILSLSPDVSARSEHDETALHYLCENGLVSGVKQVIGMGADVNATDIVGRSPLYHACSSNHVEVARLLLDRDATIDGTTVGAACRYGKMEIVNLLFERGATVNMTSHGSTPLHAACTEQNMQIIKFLIEKGASVNVQSGLGQTAPLHEASKRNPQAVQCLLQHGADTDSREMHGYTPLHTAAGRGSKECVEILLKAGADVKAQSKYGNTPLHSAAVKGSKECIDMLLEAGAHVNVQSNHGFTPLIVAAIEGSKEGVDVLLKAGACVNVQTKREQNSLHKAVYRKHIIRDYIYLPSVSVCQTLIRHGVDVNKQDTEGNTPLHLLCRVESTNEIYKNWPRQPATLYEDDYRTLLTILLDNGADVNIHNNNGELALHGWCRTLVRRQTGQSNKKK